MHYDYNYMKVSVEILNNNFTDNEIKVFVLFFSHLKFFFMKLSSFQKRKAHFYVCGVFLFIFFCLVCVWGFFK